MFEGDIQFYGNGCFHFSNETELDHYLKIVVNKSCILQCFFSSKKFTKDFIYTFDLNEIPYDLIIPPIIKIKKVKIRKGQEKVIEKDEKPGGLKIRCKDKIDDQIKTIKDSFSKGVPNSTLIKLPEDKFANCQLRKIEPDVETIFDDQTALKLCAKISTPFIRSLLKSSGENLPLLHRIAMNCFRKYGGNIITFLLSLPELQFGDNTANLLREYKGTDGSIPSFTFTFPNERDRYILWFFKMQPGSHGYQRLGCIMNLSRKTKIGYLNYNGYIEQKVAREAGKLQLFANPNDLQKLSFGVSEGRCIYCNHELTDPISLMAGYGKDCAEANFVPYF